MADEKTEGGVIDEALADTMLGRHWLHPAVRFKNDPRIAAIRAKNRALRLAQRKLDHMTELQDEPAPAIEPSTMPPKDEQ